MRRRIGFGGNAFKTITKKKKTRPAKRINQDVFDDPDRVIYFESEEHLNILINE